MLDRKLFLLFNVLAYILPATLLLTGSVGVARYASSLIGFQSEAKASSHFTESTTTNFVALLLDDDKKIREEAFARLQRLEPSDAVTYLVEETKNPNWQVRAMAVYTLGRLGKVADDAIPTVIEVAQADENSDVRLAATKALGEFASISVEPVLIKALEDPDENIRLATAQALTKLAPIAADAFPVLVRASWDGNWMVRSQAIKALMKLDATALDHQAMVNALTHGGTFDESKRTTLPKEIARDLLIKSGDYAVSTLVERYQSEDSYTFRTEIVDILAEIGGEEATDFLLRVLVSHQDSLYTSAVARSLGKLAPERAMKALEFELNSEDPLTRSKAIAKLGSLGSDEALSYLKQALFNYSENTEGIENNHFLPAAVLQMPSNHPENTEDIERAIAKIGSEESLEVLKGRSRFRETRIVDDFIRTFVSRSSEETVVRYLENELSSQDPYCRQMAIAGFDAFIAKSRWYAPNNLKASDYYNIILQSLVNSLDDKDKEVRYSALKALNKLNEVDHPVYGHAFYGRRFHLDLITEDVLPIETSTYISRLLNFISPNYDSFISNSFQGDIVQNLLSTLGSETHSQALLVLIDKINSENKEVRLNAILALGAMNPDEVIELLEEIFREGDLETRQHAVKAISKLKHDRVVPILLLALFDKELAIGSFDPLLDTLSKLPADVDAVPNEIKVEDIIEFFSSHRYSFPYDLKYNLGDWGGAVVSHLDEDGQNVIVRLLLSELIKSLDSGIHSRAIASTIGDIPKAHELVTPALIGYLNLADDDIQRYDVISYLGDIGFHSEEAIAAVQPFLESDEWSLRFIAAESLARMQAEPELFIQIFEEAWQQDEWSYEFTIAESLAENASFKALEQLIIFLQKNDLNHYRNDSQFIECYPSPFVSELVKLGDDSVPQLVDALSDSSVRSTVAKTLGRIDASESALIATLNTSTNFPRALEEVFHDKDQDIRRSAAFGLSLLDNPSKEGINALKNTVQNRRDHLEVRWMAAVSLQQHGIDMSDFFDSENQPNPFLQTCPDFAGNIFGIYEKRCLYPQHGCGDGYYGIYQNLRRLLSGRSSGND